MDNIYFYDTEFIEAGPLQPLQLISIALTSLDGRELYVVSSEFSAKECNDWVKQNVLPNLPLPTALPRLSRAEIATRVRTFVGSQRPEFWAECGCYDHVVLAQLFGSMQNYPNGWPYYTRDFSMVLEMVGRDALTTPSPKDHDALVEARWLRAAWLELRETAQKSDELRALHRLLHYTP